VNKADLLTKIADLVHEKKLDGIRDIRDESTKDIRIVIELKGSAHPQTVLNYLYKHTQLEEVFHYNVVALVDGVPQTLSLKALIEYFIAHRKEVVTRRTRFDFGKAKDREHILIGLAKALDHIDKIIALIKKSADVDAARAALMKTFGFSQRQADAILEMRLAKLAGLERKKIEDELREVQKLIEVLEALLKSEKKLLELIKKVANAQSTVLILGESGVGKELIARMIHRNSLRARERFIGLSFTSAQADAKRHELHAKALGKVKSSKSFTGRR